MCQTQSRPSEKRCSKLRYNQSGTLIYTSSSIPLCGGVAATTDGVVMKKVFFYSAKMYWCRTYRAHLFFSFLWADTYSYTYIAPMELLNDEFHRNDIFITQAVRLVNEIIRKLAPSVRHLIR